MKPEELKKHFKALIGVNKLSHAYILIGSASEDMSGLVKDIAGMITPYWENIHTLAADGISVKDRAVEALLERLSLKPMLGDRNIAIIKDSDTMTTRAQNRLLKTLEEPPGKAVIFLLSGNEENLLPTVRSRCIQFHIEGSEDEVSVDALSNNIAHLVGGAILKREDYYIIVELLEQVMQDRALAHAFLDDLEKWYRDVLVSRFGISYKYGDSYTAAFSGLLTVDLACKIVANIERTRRELNRHINVGYAIKNMILRIIYEEESI